MYSGRRTSLLVVPNFLFFHPKTVITLVLVFLPLAIGFILTLRDLIKRFFRTPKQFTQLLVENYPVGLAMMIVFAGVFFYSFIVGGEQFGRYFLPIFPFFFLIGLNGWRLFFHNQSNRHNVRNTAIVVFIICYLILAAC
jgi:hypothetical protein